MSAVLTTPCCCGPTGVCGDLQNLPSSYLLTGLSGSYSYERYGNDLCPVSQIRCYVYTGYDCEYTFSISYSLSAPVTMTRNGNCYEGLGTLDLTGSVSFIESGQRLDVPDCAESNTFPFSAQAPFCLTVRCSNDTTTACFKTFSGAHFVQYLAICDFPVVHNISLLAGDCETSDCILGDETGFRSIGAIIAWASSLKPLDTLVAGDSSIMFPGGSAPGCGHELPNNPDPPESEYACGYVPAINSVYGPFSLDWQSPWTPGLDDPPSCIMGPVAGVAFNHSWIGSSGLVIPIPPELDWTQVCWGADNSVCAFDILVHSNLPAPEYS